MDIPDHLVTITDIARMAEVELPAVSNWRRRHETFPRSERRGSRELFPAVEVARWLDDRKIARNDLKDSEPPGATYGTRFRRNKFQVAAGPELGVKKMLWKELDRFRGSEDIATYADLVLSLLYLSARKRDRWVRIAAAEAWESARLLEAAILEYEPLLLRLDRALSSFRAEPRSIERLGQIICVLDRVQRSTGSEDRWLRWSGELFEYLMHRFAAAEGKRGMVLTPPSIVRVLVELIDLKPGESVLDPCSDSGGFLLGAAKHIETRGSRASDASFFGQAILERSWSLAQMNLDLHGVPADLAVRPGVALDDNLHAGRRFDAILANPPFNMSDWRSRHPGDHRWRYGIPPQSNANFAWLQHIWSSLAEGGRAAVVMANAALSSQQPKESEIRATMVEDGVIEALIALPSQLFVATAIPVTVWLVRGPNSPSDDEILFIDARELGGMISRTQRDLRPCEIRRITDTVRQWRDRRKDKEYQDCPGFSSSMRIQDIRNHGYQLSPGRYVGTGIRTGMPADSVVELMRELDRLCRRAVEIDAIVNRQLDRITTWIP